MNDTLRQPFHATAAELEFYAVVVARWHTLSADAVLTEAARLFHFAVAIAAQAGGRTYLECPCCGDDGAASDGDRQFYDGQALICGCPGWVSVDADGRDDPYINNGDAPCLKCEANETARTVDAVDPHAASTGTPTTRASKS